MHLRKVSYVPRADGQCSILSPTVHSLFSGDALVLTYACLHATASHLAVSCYPPESSIPTNPSALLLPSIIASTRLALITTMSMLSFASSGTPAVGAACGRKTPCCTLGAAHRTRSGLSCLWHVRRLVLRYHLWWLYVAPPGIDLFTIIEAVCSLRACLSQRFGSASVSGAWSCSVSATSLVEVGCRWWTLRW